MEADVSEWLARIETKLDIFLDSYKETKAKVDKIDGWQGKLIGIAAIVGSLLTAFVLKVFTI